MFLMVLQGERTMPPPTVEENGPVLGEPQATPGGSRVGIALYFSSLLLSLYIYNDISLSLSIYIYIYIYIYIFTHMPTWSI